MNISSKKGFTLLELLIVIAIIAILSTVLIVAINPAETLRKTRDSQRISDLSSLKTAIGIYVTSTATPLLDNTVGNTLCVGGSGADSVWFSPSLTGTANDITDVGPFGGITTGAVPVQRADDATSSLVDGTGWIPVNLAGITGGSPISNMPLDPTNLVAVTTGADTSTVAVVTNGALMYRYACAVTNTAFEVDARLESTTFGAGGADDKASKDGGNNANLFEMGTNLLLFGAQNDF